MPKITLYKQAKRTRIKKKVKFLAFYQRGRKSLKDDGFFCLDHRTTKRLNFQTKNCPERQSCNSLLTGLNNLRTTYRQDVLMMKNIFNQENPIKIDTSAENLTNILKYTRSHEPRILIGGNIDYI